MRQRDLWVKAVKRSIVHSISTNTHTHTHLPLALRGELSAAGLAGRPGRTLPLTETSTNNILFELDMNSYKSRLEMLTLPTE